MTDIVLSIPSAAPPATSASVVAPLASDAKSLLGHLWTAVKAGVSGLWSSVSLSAFTKTAIVVGIVFSLGWVIKTGQVAAVLSDVSQVNVELKSIDSHLEELIAQGKTPVTNKLVKR